jgi:hypothetical protein
MFTISFVLSFTIFDEAARSHLIRPIQQRPAPHQGWDSFKRGDAIRRARLTLSAPYAQFRPKPHRSNRLEKPDKHIYEVRPRKDKRGVDLISDALPFGRLWYDGPNAVANAIGYAEHCSRSHDSIIRVYDETGNVIETHEHAGDFREW